MPCASRTRSVRYPHAQIWLLRREDIAIFTAALSITHQRTYTKFAIMTGPPVPFSQLPLNKDVPDTKLNAWGAYGKDDEKGFLNRQTDEIVKKAADSEIRTGKRYVLQWLFLATVLPFLALGPSILHASVAARHSRRSIGPLT
jgi:hypothetical protein